MDTTDLQDLADLLKALGEVNRLSLVCKLCECNTPQNAMCLCACCSVDASGVSRHLKVLSQQGIVSVEKQGRERNYSLNRAYVAQRLRVLADKIELNQENA
jgi:DNA-binding transcriptional ArsR family regulator